MRVTNLRVRIPSFSIRSQNPPVNLSDILGPNNSTNSMYDNPKLVQNVTLEVTDVDMDGDLHENYFRNNEEDDEAEDDMVDENSIQNDSNADDDDDEDDDSENSGERTARKKGFRRKYRKVNLDRPFIVYVEDSTVGTVFMGRVNMANLAEQEVTPTSENPSSPEEEEVTTMASSMETLPPK